METVYIVLIVGIIVLAIAWIYRRRLTDGFIRTNKNGFEAGLKAKDDEKKTPNSNPPEPPPGVRISSNMQKSKIDKIAGRDINEVKSRQTTKSTNGDVPGVIIDGEKITDSKVSKVAGRDIKDSTE